MSTTKTVTRLQPVLDERKDAAATPEDVRKIWEDGIEAVRDSGVTMQAKNVGDGAPEFELPDARGETVALASLLERGPVVLLWYRGGWCPYCNLTLRGYQEILPQLDDAGATLVAISPELPDNSLSTSEKNELSFTVLSDVGNTVAKEYGVVFEVTEAVHEKYNEFFQFDDWNGNDTGELPLAATYVIDTDGVIRWAFLDADYVARAEPADVLAAVRGLQSD
ncbi:MAG: peroxiredoxin-like family protein [Planctomycetota bacterium]